MYELEGIAEAVSRLQELNDTGEIPKAWAPDLQVVLDFTAARLSVVGAATEPSEEIKKVLSLRVQHLLREIHVSSFDELCAMTAEELFARCKRSRVKGCEGGVNLIRRELDRHGIVHNLGERRPLSD